MTAGMGDGFDLDMAASSLQADGADVRIMLRVLAGQLADALGNRLVVERAGGRFRRSDEIKALQVSLGDDSLRAEIDGTSVRCTVGHFSGGIQIRSERVSMDDWVKRLLGTLQIEAAHSETARRALEQFMTGDGQ